MGRVGDGFKCCANDMVFIDAARKSDNDTSCILIPVRCSETRESGYHIASGRIIHNFCQTLRFGSRIYQVKFVAQPLDGSSGNEDRSL